MSHQELRDDTVDRAMHVMEEYTGTVPGYRRAHARGIGFRGTFTAAAEAAALTTAEHFQGEPVEAVIRLSNAAGDPSGACALLVLRPGPAGVTTAFGREGVAAQWRVAGSPGTQGCRCFGRCRGRWAGSPTPHADHRSLDWPHQAGPLSEFPVADDR